MNILCESHPLTLYVFLPSLYNRSGLEKVADIIRWKKVLTSLSVIINVYADDTGSITNAITRGEQPGLHLLKDKDGKIAQEFGCYRPKTVFGDRKTILEPSMFLYDGNELLLKFCQVREGTIEKIAKKALAVQYHWTKNNLGLCVDNAI
jgi:hypothetical protein